MDWYLEALRKYAVFSGRSRRREYWSFTLFNVLVCFGLAVVDVVLLGGISAGFGLLSGLYALAVLIPGWAVSVRRLHDTGRSGWWWLILFIPLLGALVLLIFMLQDGDRGANAYGPDPKEFGGVAAPIGAF